MFRCGVRLCSDRLLVIAGSFVAENHRGLSSSCRLHCNIHVRRCFQFSHYSSQSRARSNSYASSKEFDKDMERLFEKCRRWHEQGSEQYGRVLLLQVRLLLPLSKQCILSYHPLTLNIQTPTASLPSHHLTSPTRWPSIRLHDQLCRPSRRARCRTSFTLRV